MISIALVLLVGLAMPCPGQGADQASNTAGHFSGWVTQGVFVNRVLAHGGAVRTYDLYVPDAYDGTSEWPLVFSFHGGLWDVDDHKKLDRLAEVADTAHFLVAYPRGRQIRVRLESGGWRTGPGWNVDGSFGDWDDVAFTSAMIDDIRSDYAVDLSRVHAMGFSFGSVMSFALACRLADRIASIGGVGGPMFKQLFIEGCTANRPVATLLVQGTADRIVPYTDGGIYARPVVTTPAFWARHNGCATDSLVTALPDANPIDGSTVTRFEYPDCELNAEVRLYRVNGGGHTWPGTPYRMLSSLGLINKDIDATAEIWNFLKRHPYRSSTPPQSEPPAYPSYVPFGWSLDWTFTEPEIELEHILYADAETEIVHGYDFSRQQHVVLRRADGGESWTKEEMAGDLPVREGWYVSGFFFLDPSTGFAVGDGIARTTDGGKTWTAQSAGSAGPLSEVFFADASIGIVVGDNGTILRTEDGGASWTPQSSGTSEALLDVFFADASTGIVVGDNGTILRTEDGGTTWSPQEAGTTSRLPVVFMSSPETGMVIESHPTGESMLRTADGGMTWSSERPDLGVLGEPEERWINEVYFADANTAMAAVGVRWCRCMEGAVLRTTDGGRTWQRAQFPAMGFRGIKVVDANTALAVGYTGEDEGRRGVILRLTFGPKVPTGNSDQEISSVPGSYLLHQNYPNPFNPATTISFALSERTDIELTVFDLLGRPIRTLISGQRPAGTYRTAFDASDLPSGVYLYRLRAGDKMEARRMILLR